MRFDDDASPVDARVVGTDPSSDLAVLEVDASAASGVTPLALAESDTVEVGDAAIAIGFPLGLDKTATAGIVSGLEREIESPNGFRIDKVIQTDAPINPGNSGGPLLDAKGRVIGVNSQIATAGAGGGNVGIGFAVPSDTVREIVPKLQAGQSVERPWLGLATTASATGGPGAQVGSVTAGGPAEKAGVRQGDIVTKVDGKAITDPDGVADAIASHEPGDRIEVEVTRGGAAADARDHARHAAGERAVSFASPLLLAGLALVPLLFVLYVRAERRRSRRSAAFAAPQLMDAVAPRRPRWRRHVPVAVLGLAVAAPDRRARPPAGRPSRSPSSRRPS